MKNLDSDSVTKSSNLGIDFLDLTELRKETVKHKGLAHIDWDFKEENTREYTHGIHPYPARMVPQIARRLIQEYSEAGDIVLDPMCGSGTVLTEARLAGRNSIGFDINPHALLISKVKSHPIAPEKLRAALDAIKERIPAVDLLGGPTVSKHDVAPLVKLGIDVNYWFKPSAVRGLSVIRAAIDEATTGELRDFFLVVFSRTVRAVSNTRDEEFKLYRIAKEKLDKHTPNAIRTFLQFAEASLTQMREFSKKAPKSEGLFSIVMKADARNTSLFGRADLIVTSPPYGDSHTTVAYGQFSRLSSEWLGFEDAQQIDRLSLGGRLLSRNVSIDSPSLAASLAVLEQKDASRSKEVKSFFFDLYDTLRMMSESLKDRRFACIVVGNRTVKSVKIPTNDIIVEMGSQVGFHHVETLSRRISSKTIPLQISPSNVKGETEKSMKDEYIIILRKQK